MAFQLRVWAITPERPGETWGCAWQLLEEEGVLLDRSQTDHTWAKDSAGALLQALREGLSSRFLPRGAPLILLNEWQSRKLAAMVLDPPPEGKSLYRRVARLLDGHPVALLQEGQLILRQTPGARTWQEPPTLAEARDLRRENLRLEARAAELEEEAEALRHQLARYEGRYRELTERFGRWEPSGTVPAPPSLAVLEEEVADWFTGAYAQAQQRLFAAWAESTRARAVLREDPAWQQSVLQPLVEAQFIARFDPHGNQSYEWPLFLLARYTEAILNRHVVPGLLRWVAEHCADSIRISRQEEVLHARLRVGRPDGAPGRRGFAEIRLVSRDSRLELGKLLQVFWDEGGMRAPEWQEAVSAFLVDRGLGWMLARSARDRLHALRQDRNLQAHATVIGYGVPQDTYRQWEETLILGPQAWWRAWLELAD